MNYCILQFKEILVWRYHLSTLKLQSKGIDIAIQKNFGTALPYFYSQITQRLICKQSVIHKNCNINNLFVLERFSKSVQIDFYVVNI